jgi:predicted amidophosphoribosyltransferase
MSRCSNIVVAIMGGLLLGMTIALVLTNNAGAFCPVCGGKLGETKGQVVCPRCGARLALTEA